MPPAESRGRGDLFISLESEAVWEETFFDLEYALALLHPLGGFQPASSAHGPYMNQLLGMAMLRASARVGGWVGRPMS